MKRELTKDELELWRMLDDINKIMWESFMIKSRGFKYEDGIKVMNVLNRWAKKY